VLLLFLVRGEGRHNKTILFLRVVGEENKQNAHVVFAVLHEAVVAHPLADLSRLETTLQA
jgi:hypothetical protein